MNYAISYLKAFWNILTMAGAIHLLLSTLFFDPLAAYFVFCSFIVACAGPISVSMNKGAT
jgi:hypothetical protein